MRDSRCSLCLSKLRELRADADGWANKPFDPVTIDRGRETAFACERARRAVKAGMPIALRGGDLGRPPEPWNDIAGLLP